MSLDILRKCRFAPYAKGKGPTFALTMWATPRTDSRGQTFIGYRLRQLEMTGKGAQVVDLFTGEDFAGSPMHGDDSDETVRSLMSFLTLRRGDTDADYFEGETPEQAAYRASHAEALSYEVMNRFGEG